MMNRGWSPRTGFRVLIGEVETTLAVVLSTTEETV
jgi:hypothetical protein